jgi:hypothetical protein
MHNIFSTTGVFSKVTDCKNLTAEIRLQYDDSFFQKIDEYLGAIEWQSKKRRWEDEQYMSDSDDEILERYIQVIY